MRSPGILCSARAQRGAALLFVACIVTGGDARAEPTAAAGADDLVAAREAWHKRHFAAAELHYKSALDHGGLAADDTLDAYIHLGAARAVIGKKTLARAAFRQAALLDAHFKSPKEAGKKAASVAALARRDEAKLGSITLGASIPQTVSGDESFGVDVSLDPRHAAVTAKLGIEAVDPLSGKRWATSDVAASKGHFEVPASVVLPGATLIVRVDALDPHDNRLASREQRVHVEERPKRPVLDLPPPRPSAPIVAADKPSPAFTVAATDAAHHEKEHADGHGGFWASPWPYLIGGAVLAAGGAFAYYELRPTDDVSLGGARVITH